MADPSGASPVRGPLRMKFFLILSSFLKKSGKFVYWCHLQQGWSPRLRGILIRPYYGRSCVLMIRVLPSHLPAKIRVLHHCMRYTICNNCDSAGNFQHGRVHVRHPVFILHGRRTVVTYDVINFCLATLHDVRVAQHVQPVPTMFCYKEILALALALLSVSVILTKRHDHHS